MRVYYNYAMYIRIIVTSINLLYSSWSREIRESVYAEHGKSDRHFSTGKVRQVQA